MPEFPPTRIAVVSSHGPRRCGIATFSADLTAAVKSADPSLTVVVAAIEEPGVEHHYGDEVGWLIRQGDAESYVAAARAINSAGLDLVSVQHEFGLYGSWTGDVYEDDLRPFLEALRMPVITTLHSVLPRPSESMRSAIHAAAQRSAEAVVMTQ